MKKQNFLIVLFPLALVLAAPLHAASRAQDLFQRALVKESVERDLDGAIMFYQRAIDEARSEPSISGESRLRMGICFEKLGKSVYAEGLYRQILEHPAKIPSDVLQQARTNLRRIEAEKHVVVVVGSSSTVKGTWVHPFIPLRWSFQLGPDCLLFSRGTPVKSLNLGLRYRTSTTVRPTAWYIETQGLLPLGTTKVSNITQTYESQNEAASLSLKYQISLGVVGELPHGQQKTWIPEIGTGLVLTSYKTSYESTASSGDQTQRSLRPYFQTGLHVFPDSICSLLLQARYMTTPYSKSIDIASPLHTQTFNFPSSQWSVSAMLQVKIGYRKWELKTP